MTKEPAMLKRKRLNVPTTGKLDEYLELIRVIKDNKLLRDSPTGRKFFRREDYYYFINDGNLTLRHLNGMTQELSLKKSIEVLSEFLGM